MPLNAAIVIRNHAFICVWWFDYRLSLSFKGIISAAMPKKRETRSTSRHNKANGLKGKRTRVLKAVHLIKMDTKWLI